VPDRKHAMPVGASIRRDHGYRHQAATPRTASRPYHCRAGALGRPSDGPAQVAIFHPTWL